MANLTEQLDKILYNSFDLVNYQCEVHKSYVHDVEAIVVLLWKVVVHVPHDELSSMQGTLRKLNRRDIKRDHLQRTSNPCGCKLGPHIFHPDAEW